MNKLQTEAMDRNTECAPMAPEFRVLPDLGGAAVRGEAVAESWKPNIVLIANACEKYEEGSAVGLPEHGMAQAFQYLLSKMPVSARAADAPAEPSELKSLEAAIESLDRFAEFDGEGGGVCPSNDGQFILRSSALVAINEAAAVKSRAADALDSQPDGKWVPRKLTQAMADVLEFGRKQPVHNTYLNLLAAAPDPLDSQPTEPAACGACHGSGRMVRDADIGTDQECFSCDGSGESDEASSQPTDGGVRNG